MQTGHSKGQLRAELFQDAIGMLIPRILAGDIYVRDFIVPSVPNQSGRSAFTADFGVISNDRAITLIEAKAPYNERAQSGLERTFRRLKRAADDLPPSYTIAKIILAIAAELSDVANRLLRSELQFFNRRGIAVEIWDADKLRILFATHFSQRFEDFTVEELQSLLFVQGSAVRKAPSSRMPPDNGEQEKDYSTTGDESMAAPAGGDYIVLAADLCSYSAFVHASNADNQLAVAVMRRFYREARRIVQENDGHLDKFIGDGLLVFWEYGPPVTELSKKVSDCARQLAGMSLSLSKDWQEQIDLSVPLQGMRVGAAFGPLLLISENDDADSQVHAVGEVINKAVRLSRLRPNAFAISNQLKRTIFADDVEFEERQPVELKNLGGKILYWEKSLLLP